MPSCTEQDFAPQAENGDDLPCSVCRSTIEVVRSDDSWDDGWSLQYHGDLIAGAAYHKAATQYIRNFHSRETQPQWKTILRRCCSGLELSPRMRMVAYLIPSSLNR